MNSDKAIEDLKELRKDASEINKYFQVVAGLLKNIHPK
jgi:hypothetical protein